MLKVVFGATVLAIIAAIGGIFHVYQTIWKFGKILLQSPTPIWATISLAVLVLVYIYLRFQKFPLTTSPPNEKPEIDFIENGSYKWKVYLHKNGIFSIDITPICSVHNLQLQRFNTGFSCFHISEDGCKASMKNDQYNLRKKYIIALAEQRYRGKYKPSSFVNTG